MFLLLGKFAIPSFYQISAEDLSKAECDIEFVLENLSEIKDTVLSAPSFARNLPWLVWRNNPSAPTRTPRVHLHLPAPRWYICTYPHPAGTSAPTRSPRVHLHLPAPHGYICTYPHPAGTSAPTRTPRVHLHPPAPRGYICTHPLSAGTSAPTRSPRVHLHLPALRGYTCT